MAVSIGGGKPNRKEDIMSNQSTTTLEVALWHFPTRVKKLTEKAWQIRKDITRHDLVRRWACRGPSQVEILVSLYYKYLNIDPKRPDMADRDRRFSGTAIGYASSGRLVARQELQGLQPHGLSAYTWTALK
jgi:hypothetical protein